jgi:tripartite-type tricarboxylate transporter receptor subunit TctC
MAGSRRVSAAVMRYMNMDTNTMKLRARCGSAISNLLKLFLVVACSGALAQTWPQARPVRIISFFTAGSPADALARQVAQKTGEAVGQPIVVEVQAGAGGLLAAQTVARAAPDGHTLLLTISTTFTVTPHLVKGMTIGMKDFAPIMTMAKAYTCMLAAVSFPPNDARQTLEYMKANPGKVAYGSNGIGGTYHLEMEMLKSKHKLDIIHVPYKGGTDGLQQAAAGTIPVAFAPCSSVAPLAKAGKVKFLAVLEMKRSPDYPDVPAMGELIPDYEKISGGTDLWAPGATPPAIVRRIRDEIDKTLALPELRETMKKISFPYDGTSLEAMAAQRTKDYEVATRAVKIAGLKPE